MPRARHGVEDPCPLANPSAAVDVVVAADGGAGVVARVDRARLKTRMNHEKQVRIRKKRCEFIQNRRRRYFSLPGITVDWSVPGGGADPDDGGGGGGGKGSSSFFAIHCLARAAQSTSVLGTFT